jgi:hypothetical protein
MARRKLNFFEKTIFLMSILVIVIGYFFVYGFVAREGISWEALQTTFIWLILIVMIMLAAVNENMKEELKLINLNQVREIKLLREDLKRK